MASGAQPVELKPATRQRTLADLPPESADSRQHEDGGTAATGDEDEEKAGVQQKWRRRRRAQRTGWDTNQRLAEQWKAVAPDFAYA